MRGKQVARQWKILRIIEQHERGRTVLQLMDDLGAPKRTIYRDIEALQASGFPLYQEREGRDSFWRLTDSHRKGGLPLSHTELLALHLSCDLLAAFKGAFIKDSIEAVFDKVKASLSPELHEFVTRITDAIRVGTVPARNYETFQDTLSHVSGAVVTNNRVHIVYSAVSTGKTSQRKVDPYHVLVLNGSMYVIGFCHLRKEVRTFALERIKDVEVLDEGFVVPRDFSLDAYLNSAFKIMTGAPEWVRIKFRASVAHTVAERVWHPSQSLEKEPDGAVILTLCVPVNHEVISWILGFGPAAEALEPPQLRNLVQSALKDASRLYGAKKK